MPEKNMWLFYVALAGLSWGSYVPLIAYGGSELGGKAGSGRMVAILCVGVAYFLIGVAFPLYLFLTGKYEWPPFSFSGLTFSGLAGVAGAVGALCVIFATASARSAAMDAKPDPNYYKLYIAPLIFGLAPVINTLVSVFWHPQKGAPFHFGIEMPGWKLWVGIILIGVGAALVLFSKEENEASHSAVPKPTASVALAETKPEPKL